MQSDDKEEIRPLVQPELAATKTGDGETVLSLMRERITAPSRDIPSHPSLHYPAVSSLAR